MNTSLQKLTLKSTASDNGLDGLTKHFRVGISSTTPLSLAASPLLLDVFVKYVGPCYNAVLSNNGGLPPLVNTVMTFPHPDPLIYDISDFPVSVTGCGTQTITLIPVGAITPGTQADFISIGKVGLVWKLTVAPTNSAQNNLTFKFKLSVKLDSFPSKTYT